MSRIQGKILIIDDQEDFRRLLTEMLLDIELGVEIIEAGSIEEGWHKVFKDDPDLVFLDLEFYGDFNESARLLRVISTQRRDIPVILVSNHATMPPELAKAHWNVYYFIAKPPKEEQLKYIVPNALKFRLAQKRNESLEQRAIQSRDELEGNYENIWGESLALLKVLGIIERCARTDSTVLIQGESGTGKELIAKALHQNSSRAHKEMIVVNCAAIPDTLLESELFGHERGAFTGAIYQKIGKFERAHGSTLFLDEIGDMPLALQAKLLRALQGQEIERIGGTKVIRIDVRIVAATNHDLHQAVKNGKFREDLYYRLNVISLKVPPLRERKEDIPLLANRFAEQNGKKMSPEAIACLTLYDWPGNIRELQNEIERAAVMARNAEVQVEELSPHLQKFRAFQSLEGPPLTLTLKTLNLEYVKQLTVQKALEMTGGNKNQAAKLLDVTPQGLFKMLHRYGLME